MKGEVKHLLLTRDVCPTGSLRDRIVLGQRPFSLQLLYASKSPGGAARAAAGGKGAGGKGAGGKGGRAGQQAREAGGKLGAKHCAVFGRQILEAMHFLQRLGVTLGAHVTTNNVLMRDGGTCVLSECENALLGLPARRTLPAVPLSESLAQPLTDEVLAFGLVLWEMARPALPRSWVVFKSPSHIQTTCSACSNRQHELTLSHPTAAATATSCAYF